MVYQILYNNPINECAPIGQSAVGYWAGKPMEKIACLLNYYIKAIAHKFIRVVGPTWDVCRTLEEFVNDSPAARGLQILLMFYQHPAWFIIL